MRHGNFLTYYHFKSSGEKRARKQTNKQNPKEGKSIRTEATSSVCINNCLNFQRCWALATHLYPLSCQDVVVTGAIFTPWNIWHEFDLFYLTLSHFQHFSFTWMWFPLVYNFLRSWIVFFLIIRAYNFISSENSALKRMGTPVHFKLCLFLGSLLEKGEVALRAEHCPLGTKPPSGAVVSVCIEGGYIQDISG